MSGNSYQHEDKLCGRGHDEIYSKNDVQQLLKKKEKKEEEMRLDDCKQKTKTLKTIK